jgi:hypothetical protein
MLGLCRFLTALLIPIAELGAGGGHGPLELLLLWGT